MSYSNDKLHEAIAKFRNNLSDVLLPHHDDYYLKRWLVANFNGAFDLKKSEIDFRANLKWRETVGADTILTEWTAPEVLKKHFVGGVCGYDKEGRPVWIEPLGHSDMKGLLLSARKNEIMKLKVQHCELIHSLIVAQRAKLGEQVDGLIVVFDLEHLGMHHLWKPALDLYCEILTMYERHFPEILKRSYIINAPRIFPIAYSLVKPFLSEGTKRKIVMLDKNWKLTLLQVIDASQLPIHWGGTDSGPGGDPYCSHKVNMGGEVSSHFHIPSIDLVDQKNFTRTVVHSLSSLDLEFHVQVPNSTIRYQFSTERRDIGFQVSYVSSEGDYETLVPASRVNSHMIPENGSVLCTKPGLYVVKFDNTYSRLNKKRLFYMIDVIEPTDDLPVAYPSASQDSVPL